MNSVANLSVRLSVTLFYPLTASWNAAASLRSVKFRQPLIYILSIPETGALCRARPVLAVPPADRSTWVSAL